MGGVGHLYQWRRPLQGAHAVQTITDIFTTDACPTGYAVCRSKACCSLVAQIGREDEGWRYYRGGPERRAPRSAALDTSLVFEDPLTVKPDYVNECELLENPEFREVPTHILEPEQWHQLWNSRFNGKEPIHVLECRSVLAAVKHITRNVRMHDHRVLPGGPKSFLKSFFKRPGF